MKGLKIKPNKIAKLLILSDLSFWGGWGLIAPIFAIFIVNKIEGGTMVVAGVASAIYWITNSLFRIPAGILLDTIPSEKDDYFFLVSGLFMASIVPLGYIFARTPAHIYILQFLHGLAIATSLSGWSAIFTRHIDKGRESTDWGIDAMSIGLGMGVAGAIGGWLADKVGFNFVFILVSLFGLIGVVFLLGLRKDIRGVFDKESLKHGLFPSIKDIFDRQKK